MVPPLWGGAPSTLQRVWGYLQCPGTHHHGVGCYPPCGATAVVSTEVVCWHHHHDTEYVPSLASNTCGTTTTYHGMDTMVLVPPPVPPPPGAWCGMVVGWCTPCSDTARGRYHGMCIHGGVLITYHGMCMHTYACREGTTAWRVPPSVAWYLVPTTYYVPLYRHREPMEGWYLLPMGGLSTSPWGGWVPRMGRVPDHLASGYLRVTT